jgi:hypothetical protein
VPAVVTVNVAFVPVPADAKITVDGKAITGTSATVTLKGGKKTSIKVVAKASGYRTFERKYDIEAESEIPIKLEKRKSGGGGGGGGGGGSSGPGDKIDL